MKIVPNIDEYEETLNEALKSNYYKNLVYLKQYK